MSLVKAGVVQGTPRVRQDAPKQVSRECEALFLSVFLKEVLKTSIGAQGALKTGIWSDVLCLEMARCLSHNGTGLADAIERSLEQNAHTTRRAVSTPGGDRS